MTDMTQEQKLNQQLAKIIINSQYNKIWGYLNPKFNLYEVKSDSHKKK